MNKNQLLLILSVFLITACYPVASFQGPDVLPQGQESIGIGARFLTNMFGEVDTTSGTETTLFTEGAITFRGGLGKDAEIGLKFVGLPWRGGSTLLDVKWQFLQEPFQVTADLGLSYWEYSGTEAFIGYHPTLIAGADKFFVNIKLNFLRSDLREHQTQDLVFGRHLDLQDSDYRLTPLFGLHRSEDVPGDIYYSLGFGFSRPISGWSFR